MKVSELIAELQKFPPDADVLRRDRTCGDSPDYCESYEESVDEVLWALDNKGKVLIR